ncbi:SDR family NAD(P)-dependent oxidoreductase [Paenibacillaceae bacterium WGS1546]|uniref:SDR family NAD(P)-dependent oxidoreductase n=1 Tax=Cohnella sp. WGS1546 TaxID=3366810 RepID=UPI00372CF6C1
MKNVLVAGGTSGMGKGLAIHYLRQGSRVTVVGNNSDRGRQFLEEAARIGAGEHAAFIQANLMSVEETRRVIEEAALIHQSLDGLVLSANMPFPKRKETPDGYEATFAMYYVSRFILSYGLTDLLEKGNAPVIVSIGGTGMTKGDIHWDDLTLRQGYGVVKAMLQGGRANDLLGVAYAHNHPGGKTKFILVHPGYTDSGTNHVKQPLKAIMQLMGKLFARPVEKSIQPIIRLMDNPLPQPLIAWDRNKPVDLSIDSLNPAKAQRLFELTKHLITE